MTKEEEKYTTIDTEQCKWWVNGLFNIAKEKAYNSHNFDDGEEMQAVQDKIIKALEIVEEFEKAQIITGGRLNGRTYAYKCGLKDGKRKALEQQPSDDCVSRAEVKQFVEYIQSIKDSHNAEGTPINYGTICDLVIRGWKLMELPPVTPTHGTCKDCRWLITDEDGNYYCRQTGYFDSLDFYCADYEKRGDENVSS